MAWFYVDRLTMSPDWQFSQSIEDSIYIRLSHTFTRDTVYGFMGLYALGSRDYGLTQFYKPNNFFGHSGYKEIITLPLLEDIFLERNIALRNLKYWTGFDWNVTIERWIG